MDAPPAREQLAEELGRLLRYGLGRSPRGLSEADVQGLSNISAELVDDPDEEWPLRIARAVVNEIAEIRQSRERLALADIFGVELDEARSVDQVIEDIENDELAVLPLEGPNGRYDQAGQRFRDTRRPNGYKARYVSDTLRSKWLNRLAERLLSRAKSRQAVVPTLPTVQVISRHIPSHTEHLTLCALDLKYSALTSRFLAHINVEVTDTPRMPHDWRAWEACALVLFEAWIEFLKRFNLNPIYAVSSEDFRQGLNDRVPENVLDDVDLHASAILGAGPPLTGHHKIAFGMYTETGEDRRRIDEYFHSLWLGWYGVNLQHDTFFREPADAPLATPPLGIDRLVVESATIVRLLRPYLPRDTRVISDAQRTAHKRLASYYSFDDWVPVLHGRSLRDYADGFFATDEAELAKAATAWHDSDS